MTIKIGTRGSRLALAQTDLVIEALKARDPSLEITKKIIKTKGDKMRHLSLDKIGDKGLFVREIEEQLVSGAIDLAVHSLKDMPYQGVAELALEPVLQRQDARDVLVTKQAIGSLDELKPDAVIATGSKRRAAQLRKLMPTVTIVPIRGNVETRIQKMLDGATDGTLLAAAGLARLGIKSCADYQLTPLQIAQMIPAPAQGIIAAQYRKNDRAMQELVEAIIDPWTHRQATVERLFLKEVKGSCHVPMGAHLSNDDGLSISGLYGDKACYKVASQTVICEEYNVEKVMVQLAQRLYQEVTQ